MDNMYICEILNYIKKNIASYVEFKFVKKKSKQNNVYNIISLEFKFKYNTTENFAIDNNITR